MLNEAQPSTGIAAERIKSRSYRMLNEAHHSEVEKVLLYISEARDRAERARAALVKDGAEPYLVAALSETEERLRQEHRRLLQHTLWKYKL